MNKAFMALCSKGMKVWGCRRPFLFARVHIAVEGNSGVYAPIELPQDPMAANESLIQRAKELYGKAEVSEVVLVNAKTEDDKIFEVQIIEIKDVEVRVYRSYYAVTGQMDHLSPAKALKQGPGVLADKELQWVECEIDAFKNQASQPHGLVNYGFSQASVVH
ncbi:hypothetical protein [Neptuniibacter sp. QD37_11]|uniref:hypothetical protein n=1 Tax=Neptuniibacter sp. QD37_11 TaxID=3398209 RepID=UPI0039F55DA0